MAQQPTTSGSLRDLPPPTRFACIGAISSGTIGAAAGLVAGLVSYPPTAWFAVLELGLPATIAGGVVGLIAGIVAALTGAMKR